MKEGLESLGKLRLQGILLVTVAFLTGALAGVAGERIRASRVPEPLPFERPFGPPRAGRGGAGGPARGFEFVPQLYERLDLTEDQRSTIRRIFEESRPITDSILGQTFPLLRATMDSVRRAVHAVLTPEQRDRLDTIVEAFGRRAGFRGRGMRPGPPGGPGSLPR